MNKRKCMGRKNGVKYLRNGSAMTCKAGAKARTAQMA